MTTTKRKHAKKMLSAASALLLAAMLATACGSTNNGQENRELGGTPPTEQSDETSGISQGSGGAVDGDSANTGDGSDSNEGGAGQPSSEPGEGGGGTVEEPGVADPDTPVSSDADSAPVVQQAEGIYNGQIDGHSVEIETANGPAAFQIEEQLAETVAALEPDTKIRYEFYEKEVDGGEESVKQLWLTKIEAVQ